MKAIALLPIVAVIFLSGCVSQQAIDTGIQEAPKQASEPQSETRPTAPSISTESLYQGKVIAGTATKYIRFNKADYQKALDEEKVIYFYFYASWCPICAKERPSILEAFNEMDYPNVVGFEVHFTDDEVTPDDEEISRQFGISYQHTTIIHVVGIDKTGKEAFRSLSPISKETIKEKIAGLL